jgi:hypothetical protein
LNKKLESSGSTNIIGPFTDGIETKIDEYNNAKAQAQAQSLTEPDSQSTDDEPGRTVDSNDDGDVTLVGNIFNQGGGKKVNKTKKSKKSKKNHQKKHGRKTRKNRS